VSPAFPLDSNCAASMALVDWVCANGGLISGVEIRDTPHGGRGIFATRELAPGEQVIRLPRHLLVTGDAARAEPCVAAVLRDAAADGVDESIGELAACDPDVTAMVLFLMAERIRVESGVPRRKYGGEPRKDWSLWIRSLPGKLLSPCTVDEDVLATRLEDTYLLPFAFRVRDELQTLYDAFIVPYAIEKHPESFPEDETTFELFLWAFSVTESRAFDLTKTVRESSAACPNPGETADDDGTDDGSSSEEDVTLTVLTPFADMMNHSCHDSDVTVVADACHPEGEDRTADSKGFQMRVKSRPVAAGEQLFISYGALDNSMLLLHYGFATPGNPHDKIPLQLTEPEDLGEEENLKKAMLLGLACNGKLGLQHDLTAADPLPALLLATLRLLLLDDVDADTVTFRTDFYSMVSPQNEASVLNLLGEILKPFCVPERAMRVAEPGTAGAAFEENCDIFMGGKREIIDLAQERLKALKDRAT
jgi:SET domain